MNRRTRTTVGWLAILGGLLVLSVGLSNSPAGEQPAVPLQQRIAQWVQQLGDADYNVRQQAQRELGELGFAAFDALVEASKHDDLEVATRARYLLRLIRVEWSSADDPPAIRQLMSVYPNEPVEIRHGYMRLLAGMPDAAGIPALCRLVRFEQSDVLSKQAAIEIIKAEPIPESDRKRFAENLAKHLTPGPRPGVAWLLTHLKFHADARAALAAWTKIAQSEEELLKHKASLSSPEIVTILLYRQARAEAELDDRQAADKTAQRALAVCPVDEKWADSHRLAAYLVLRWGFVEWAQAEFQSLVESEKALIQAFGRRALAEIQHDQGNDQTAAETLQAVVQLIDDGELSDPGPRGTTRGELLGRVNYYRACHWKSEGQLDKYRQSLDAAVAADPAELDALIARHRLDDVEPQYHAKTVAMIEAAAATLRQEIAAEPNSPSAYNQFAWLVGNTEGDPAEALKYARTAVQLSPNAAAYHDTLAHVYFHQGDYDAAVQSQTRAVELEPRSELIRKQLEVFREKQREENESAQQQDAEPAEKTPGDKKPSDPAGKAEKPGDA